MKTKISTSLIVNPHRRKRIEDFVDSHHRVMMTYYELLESTESDAALRKGMKRLIEKDPDFYDSYI